MTRFSIVTAALLLVGVGGSANAQEQGQVGVNMSTGSSVGVVWQMSDRIAIRPELAWNRSNTDSTSSISFGISPGGPTLVSTTTTSSKSTGVAPELNVLFSLGTSDNVRTYLGAGYLYNRQTQTATSVTTAPLNTGFVQVPPRNPETRTIETTSAGHSGIAFFGAQYTPHRRIGVFGEVGVRYTRTRPLTREPAAADLGVTSSVRNSTVGTAAGVGVVLYLK
jgi:hypothetical protein